MHKFIKIYFSWKGRVCRKTYWIFNIPFALVAVFLEYSEKYNTVPQDGNLVWFLLGLVNLFILYPILVLNIKRAHDRNRTGWFLFLFLVPIINFWPFLELSFSKGADSMNKYGPPDNFWSTSTTALQDEE